MSPLSPPITVRGRPPRGVMLDREFFGRPSDEVAADLVGKVLWRSGVGGGRLTEVEAYLPEGDAACHAAKGRTRRNTAMFEAPGRLYVFFSYGMHTMLNLVCDQASVGSAVLVRAFEPLGDSSMLRANRTGRLPRLDASDGGPADARPDGPWISCGPGRVAQALAISLDMSGMSLGEESGVVVLDDGCRPEVGRTTRIGISRGESLPLRYYMVGNDYVSHTGRTIGGDRA